MREAYAYADDAEIGYDTLEIRHPAFTQPIRVVNDFEDLNATLEASAPLNAGEEVTFQAFGFSFDRPAVDDQGRPRITVQLDAVNQEALDAVALATQSSEPVEITYRAFLSSDLAGGPQNDPPLHLVVQSVSASLTSISCEAVLDGFHADQPFPGVVYTTRDWPGLIQ
jgi:hypothetical protein